jgi:hypothetical protein
VKLEAMTQELNKRLLRSESPWSFTSDQQLKKRNQESDEAQTDKQNVNAFGHAGIRLTDKS